MPSESTQQLQSMLSDWEIGGAKVLRDSGRLLSDTEDLIADLESREADIVARTTHLELREKLVNESLSELHRLMRILGCTHQAEAVVSCQPSDAKDPNEAEQRSQDEGTEQSPSKSSSLSKASSVPDPQRRFRLRK